MTYGLHVRAVELGVRVAQRVVAPEADEDADERVPPDAVPRDREAQHVEREQDERELLARRCELEYARYAPGHDSVSWSHDGAAGADTWERDGVERSQNGL